MHVLFTAFYKALSLRRSVLAFSRVLFHLAFVSLLYAKQSKAREGPIHPQSMGTRRDVIVLDNGGATIKVGFAGDDQPMW
jgi:hypothetical protein